MPNLKVIKQEIENTKTIESITQALGDISTMKLKATRKTVEHGIRFFQDISQVYRVVKILAIKSKGANALKRKTNNKTVCILLTSNSHFYGGLDNELTKFFVANTLNLESDRIVIGSSGKELLLSMHYPHKFEYIKFKEDSPDYGELRALTDKVFNYSKILVFHTKFVTVLNQIPTISDVSASGVDQAIIKQPTYYILEPEIDKMIIFFQSQISILLFQSIFAEVDIARLSARMISMNQAEDKAKKLLNSQQKTLLRIKKEILSSQAIASFSFYKQGG